MIHSVAQRLCVPIALSVLLLSACHRPVAYFQPTYRTPAARVPVGSSNGSLAVSLPAAVVFDSLRTERRTDVPDRSVADQTVADLTNRPVPDAPDQARVERRMRRIASLLAAKTSAVDRQPKPKPAKQLRLGNRIRQGLGLPLRKELNWWQRISWKLKASVIVILVAVVFAILHITLLAIIFGVVGAFLMVSGLRRSFKVRRPWF